MTKGTSGSFYLCPEAYGRKVVYRNRVGHGAARERGSDRGNNRIWGRSHSRGERNLAVGAAIGHAGGNPVFDGRQRHSGRGASGSEYCHTCTSGNRGDRWNGHQFVPHQIDFTSGEAETASVAAPLAVPMGWAQPGLYLSRGYGEPSDFLVFGRDCRRRQTMVAVEDAVVAVEVADRNSTLSQQTGGGRIIPTRAEKCPAELVPRSATFALLRRATLPAAVPAGQPDRAGGRGHPDTRAADVGGEHLGGDYRPEGGSGCFRPSGEGCRVCNSVENMMVPFPTPSR